MTTALRLSLTGKPMLDREPGSVFRLPRKAFILAAYLVLGNGTRRMSRREVANFLWEGVDSLRNSGNLRQLLSRLNSLQNAEEFELFHFDEETVWLDPAAEIDVEILMRPDVSAKGRDMLAVCDAWSGDLLLGLEDGGETYLSWLRRTRAHLRSRFVTLVTKELEAAAGVLTPEECLRLARRLLDADRMNEVGLRVMLRAHRERSEWVAIDRLCRRLEHLRFDEERALSVETLDLVEEVKQQSRMRPEAAALRTPGSHPENGSATATDRFARAPCLYIGVPDVDDVPPNVGQRFRALLDDAAIRLWQMRTFSLVRPSRAVTDVPGIPEGVLRRRSDYAITGRTVSTGEMPRLVVELTRSGTGEVLWIHEWSLDAPDAHEAQRIATDGVRYVERSEFDDHIAHPENATAYRATLAAKRLLREIDLRSIRGARQILRSALKLDPHYAPALAAIARTFRLEWLRLAREQDKDALEAALRFSRQAIAADPEGGQGEHQLGMASLYRKDHDFALSMLARAERQLPNDEEIIADHADALFCAGALPAGYEKLIPLLEGPFDLSDNTLWVAASGFYMLRRYEEAIKLLDRQSDKDSSHQLRAACHAMLSQFEEARFFVKKTKEVLPDFRIGDRLRIVPLRRQEDLDHYREGLLLAGFDP